MKRLPPLLPLLFAMVASPAFSQTSPVDGQWRGRSDGGTCNAPLDYVLFIEAGIVDGTAYDATAHGPVPNLRKSEPPPPTPGLWQIHGLAKADSFSLLAVASVKSQDRRTGRLNVSSQGGTLTVIEAGGCGRTARLAKG
jgi:hypothetical protein